jgi:hypothetical protein
MRNFKQFIEEAKKRDIEYIANYHGSHHHKELKEYIVNSHDTHYIPLEEDSTPSVDSFSAYTKKNFNPGLGNDPAEHMSRLNAVHPLTNTHANHLSKWASSSSTLTDAMLTAHKSGKPLQSGTHWGHDVGGLDKATNNNLRVGTVVHSGISFDPAKTDGHMVSHLSTSTDPKVAHFFATKKPRTDENTGEPVHRMLRIQLKKGDPAAVIGAAKHPETGKPISEYNHEHEVLIGRTLANGKRLKINPKPEVYRDSQKRLIHVHHAELEDAQ